MKILVLNCGSSSIKDQVLEMEPQPELLAKGLVERVGLEMGIFTHKPVGKEKYYVETPIANHEVGVKLVLEALMDPKHGVITSLDEINAVGHRVAHGGEYFKESMIIGDKEREEIAKLCELAPLHNPASLLGIDVMKKLLPNVKHEVAHSGEKCFLRNLGCRCLNQHAPVQICVKLVTASHAHDNGIRGKASLMHLPASGAGDAKTTCYFTHPPIPPNFLTRCVAERITRVL